MNELDVLSTLGREFCATLGAVIPGLSGQDAYEVFSSVLDDDVSLTKLRTVNGLEIEALRSAAQSFLESAEVTSEHIRQIVRATVSHCQE